MEGRVHVVTCGVASQMSEVKHALLDCMQGGYWLVLQNAHLAETWTTDMLELIKVESILWYFNDDIDIVW